MGAALGCFRGAIDDNVDFEFVSGQYQSLGGRRSSDEKSFRPKYQRSLSTTWRGHYDDNSITSSITTSSKLQANVYDSDDDHESISGSAGGPSTASGVTSGSRLLSSFYNLVLECDHSKFFIDHNGNKVKGAYLHEVKVIDNYFGSQRGHVVATRRRHRSFVDTNSSTKPKHGCYSISYQPPVSTWSTISNETSATMSSDSDYWSLMETFMQADDESIHQSLPHCSQHDARSDCQRLYPREYSTMVLFSPVKSTSCSIFQPPMETTKRQSYNLWMDETSATTTAARRKSLTRAAASHTVMPVAS